MINEQNSVRELMATFGYSFKSMCHCDGHETHKYKKGDIELRWRKYKYRFQITRGRYLLSNWTKVIDLEETLKKLHPDVAIQQQTA
jgi:thermostable 8-oxoguanine DNA glycosylase